MRNNWLLTRESYTTLFWIQQNNHCRYTIHIIVCKKTCLKDPPWAVQNLTNRWLLYKWSNWTTTLECVECYFTSGSKIQAYFAEKLKFITWSVSNCNAVVSYAHLQLAPKREHYDQPSQMWSLWTCWKQFWTGLNECLITNFLTSWTTFTNHLAISIFSML